MGHVWSGGAVSQWARHDPIVNKTTTTLYIFMSISTCTSTLVIDEYEYEYFAKS